MRFYSKNEQGHCGFLEDWCAHLWVCCGFLEDWCAHLWVLSYFTWSLRLQRFSKTNVGWILWVVSIAATFLEPESSESSSSFSLAEFKTESTGVECLKRAFVVSVVKGGFTFVGMYGVKGVAPPKASWTVYCFCLLLKNWWERFQNQLSFAFEPIPALSLQLPHLALVL